MGMILIPIFLCACQVYTLYWVPAHQLRGEVIGGSINPDRVSYVGSLVCPVFSGPKYLTDRVTLLDPTQREDPDRFTIVDVGEISSCR